MNGWSFPQMLGRYGAIVRSAPDLVDQIWTSFSYRTIAGRFVNPVGWDLCRGATPGSGRSASRRRPGG
jgi:hypothetical protein